MRDYVGESYFCFCVGERVADFECVGCFVLEDYYEAMFCIALSTEEVVDGLCF